MSKVIKGANLKGYCGVSGGESVGKGKGGRSEGETQETQLWS